MGDNYPYIYQFTQKYNMSHEAALMKIMDANKDGKITPEEVKANGIFLCSDPYRADSSREVNNFLEKNGKDGFPVSKYLQKEADSHSFFDSSRQENYKNSMAQYNTDNPGFTKDVEKERERIETSKQFHVQNDAKHRPLMDVFLKGR